jgi:hypothetical protein
MSLTLQALAALDAEIGALPRRLKLPAPAESAKLLALLGAAEAAPRAPDGLALEALRARLAAALSKPGLNADVAPRDLRMAPWVLWNGTPPAVTFPGLLDAVHRHAADSPRTLWQLIEAWIRDFKPDAPMITEAGLAIRRLLARNQGERFAVWRAADRSLMTPGPTS